MLYSMFTKKYYIISFHSSKFVDNFLYIVSFVVFNKNSKNSFINKIIYVKYIVICSI